MKNVIAAIIALIATLLIALAAVAMTWAGEPTPEQFGGTWETLQEFLGGTWE